MSNKKNSNQGYKFLNSYISFSLIKFKDHSKKNFSVLEKDAFSLA